jgi:CheY-like chemotaxis protein
MEWNKLALNQQYDLVILDLGLPSARGLDVLRGISPQKPRLSRGHLDQLPSAQSGFVQRPRLHSNYPRSGCQIGESAKIS